MPNLTAEQRAKGDLLDLDNLQEAMTQHYQAVMCAGGKKKVKVMKMKFHLSLEIPESVTDVEDWDTLLGTAPVMRSRIAVAISENKFMSCHRCGKKGHIEKYCWDNLNNTNVPEWYMMKKKKQHREVNNAAASTGGSDMEVFF